MPLLPTPIVDYSAYDFDSLRARLYALISATFPAWSEQSVASFGNLLIELMAHVGDVLGFYLDARARESRLTQATERRSVVALAKLLGYAPEGATAAQTDVVFTLARAAAAPVPISEGSVVRTLGAAPVDFQVLESLTIPAGALTATATVEHSTTHFEAFAASALPNQEVQLRESPFLDLALHEGGVVGPAEYVAADNGVYTRVDHFLESGASDRHYTLVVDQQDRARLRFGSGIAGQLPTGTIYVQYKTGGGPSGNVDPHAIRRIAGSFVDTSGNAVQLSVDNPARATGGKPRKSRAEIQAEAPARLRVLTRTVAREDYEINARRVPGVARALMLTSNEVPSVGENRGQLYVVPHGGGKPSSALKQAVYTMCTRTFPNTVTFQLSVLDPAYLTVNIHATVFPVKGANLKLLDAAIRVALYEHFQLTIDEGTEDERPNPNINFGFYAAQTSSGGFDGQLALSDLQNVVRDVRGVRKLGDGINDFLLNNGHRDLKVQAHQLPRLGMVTLIHGETRAPLV
jgi:Baseplate J-like protein